MDESRKTVKKKRQKERQKEEQRKKEISIEMKSDRNEEKRQWLSELGNRHQRILKSEGSCFYFLPEKRYYNVEARWTWTTMLITFSFSVRVLSLVAFSVITNERLLFPLHYHLEPALSFGASTRFLRSWNTGREKHGRNLIAVINLVITSHGL